MESHDPITAGQIGKLQDLIGAALRKSDLQNEPVQQVLEQQGAQVIDEMVAVFRKYVEAMSDMIVRRVRVDRSRRPQQALDATGRTQYTNDSVVRRMPRGEGEEVEVYLFPVRCDISDDDLEKEFALRSLKPVDPYTLAAVNESDPAFADSHPNATHWQDSDGKWCHAAFYRWDGERSVNVNRSGSGWDDGWWFAGLRK